MCKDAIIFNVKNVLCKATWVLTRALFHKSSDIMVKTNLEDIGHESAFRRLAAMLHTFLSSNTVLFLRAVGLVNLVQLTNALKHSPNLTRTRTHTCLPHIHF
jgi:hypothetical protein